MHIQTRFTFNKIKFDQENEIHLLVSLKAPKTDWQDKRPPVCIIPVIDMSSSMDGDKLEYAKKSVIKLIEHLRPGDFCGVISFADEVHTLFKPMEMTQEKKEQLKAKVGDLVSQGCTNFSGGMCEGLEQANKGDFPEGMLVRVIMFTDGQANRGIATKREQLLPLLEGALGKVTLSAFGYGSDADQELLADLAKKGKGNYAFVKNPDDALSAFAKELGGLLSTYAQNIEIHVAPHNGHIISEVVSDVDVVQDGKGVKIKLPDILAEEERHIVVAMKLSKQAQALPRAMNAADVKVTYEMLTEGGKRENKTEELKSKITFVKDGDQQVKPAEDVDKIVALAQLVRKQVEAEVYAKRGEYKTAGGILVGAQLDFQARGLSAHANAAGTAAKAMEGHVAYVSNQGYLNSMKSGGSRAYGTSGLDDQANVLLGAMGVSVSSPAQHATVQSFTGNPDVAGCAPVVLVQVTPAVPTAPAKKESADLSKKKSSARW